MISYIGYSSESNASYAVEYQNAFEYLFNNRDLAKKESKNYDLPLLYLIRHYLELSFKYNIEYFKDYSGHTEMLSSLNTSHNIEKLYSAFKSHFCKSISDFDIDGELDKQINMYFRHLNKLVNTIKLIDNTGEKFKYSYDRDGNINIMYDTTIDLLEDIAKPYKESRNLLDYSINVYKDLLKRQH